MAEKVKLDVVFDDDFSAPAKKAGNASADLAAQMAKIDRIATGTSGALSKVELKLKKLAVGNAQGPVTYATALDQLGLKLNAAGKIVEKISGKFAKDPWAPAKTSATQLSQAMRRPSVAVDRLGNAFVAAAMKSKLLRSSFVLAAGASNSLASRGITLTSAVGGINSAFERLAGGGFVRNLAQRLRSFFTMAVAGFAAATAAATAFFAYSVGQAGMLRERMSLAFGSADEFERIKQLSLEMRVPLSDASEQMLALTNAGFKKGLATELFKRGQDLQALGAQADDVKRAIRTIGQIKSAGVLQGDELNELANAQIGRDFVYEALAKNLGKTKAEIIKMKEAGKITSTDAIQAILDVIKMKAQGKDPGELAKLFNNSTVGGAIKSLKALASNALDDIAVAAQPAFLAVGAAINDVTAALQTGDADKFKKSLGAAFNATARAINVVWSAWKQLAAGFTDVMLDGGGLAEINRALGGIFDDVDAEGTGLAFRQLGKAIALTTVLLVKLVAIGADVGEQFSYAAGVVNDQFGPALKGLTVPMSVVEKLAKGIALSFAIIGVVLIGTTLLALSPLIALLGIVALALTAATVVAYGLIKAFEAIAAAARSAGDAISNVMPALNGFSGATIGFGAMPGIPTLPALPGGGIAPASMGLSAIERGGQSEAPAVVGGSQGMDLSGLASMFTSSGDGGSGASKTINFDYSINVESTGGGDDVEATWQQLRPRVRREVELGIKNAGDM